LNKPKRLLGAVEVGTNKRVTMPAKLLDTLKVEDEDFLLFYEDSEGNIVVEAQKG